MRWTWTPAAENLCVHWTPSTANSCVHYLFLNSHGPHALVILASIYKVLASGTPGRTLPEALPATPPSGEIDITSLPVYTKINENSLSLAGPVGRQRVKDVYLCEWKTANFGPLRGRNPSCDLLEIWHR